MIVAKKSYSNLDYPVYDNYAYDYDKYNDNIKKKNSLKNLNKKYIRNHAKKVKKQLKLIAIVLVMFCIGILVIGRYAMIMSLNNQCTTLKSRIASNQKENDNLRLELMKYYDIKQIEKEATTKLNMIRPTNNIVSINITKDNKNSEPKGLNGQTVKVSILNRLVNLFN